MANVLYPSGTLNLLRGNFHFTTYGPTGSSTIPASSSYAVLLSDGGSTGHNWYDANQETYDQLANFSTGAVGSPDLVTASAPVLLTGITCSAGGGVSAGCIDADDVVFSSVPANIAGGGAQCTGVALFQSSSVAGTDYLFGFYATGSGGPIAITPNGGDITVTWNASGVMCLSGGC
jgi:hypothetical protein